MGTNIESELFQALYRGGALTGPLLNAADLRKLQGRVLQRVAQGSEKAQILEEIFPHTTRGILKRSPQRDLANEFMQSPHFDRYVELPFTREGISREEAYAGFLAQWVLPEERETLQHELLFYLMRELAANPEPFFNIECPDITLRNKGYVAVLRRTAEAPYLYASLDGKFIHGPLTPLLADLIECQRVSVALSRHRGEKVHAAIWELHTRRLLD